MARIKRGTVSRRKHKKLLSLTKGYKGTRSKLTKNAKEAMLHAGSYAYQGRKKRKSDFRRLWITRIGQAAKQEGISYSQFMHKLKVTDIQIDRKMLSDLILNDNKAFKKLVDRIKSN